MTPLLILTSFDFADMQLPIFLSTGSIYDLNIVYKEFNT